MKAVAASVLAIACLAACSPQTETGASADGARPAATEIAEPAEMLAPEDVAEGPAEGKWKVTTTVSGRTMPAQDVCYEKQVSFAEAEKMQQQAGMTCSEQSYRRDGAVLAGHSVCTTNGVTMTTDTRVTGDFKTKYTMDMTTRMDPPPMPSMAESKMSITMERLGNCDPT
jgi:Protein of unknown function (DUF3617)